MTPTRVPWYEAAPAPATANDRTAWEANFAALAWAHARPWAAACATGDLDTIRAAGEHHDTMRVALVAATCASGAGIHASLALAATHDGEDAEGWLAWTLRRAGVDPDRIQSAGTTNRSQG